MRQFDRPVDRWFVIPRQTRYVKPTMMGCRIFTITLTRNINATESLLKSIASQELRKTKLLTKTGRQRQKTTTRTKWDGKPAKRGIILEIFV